MRTQIHQHKAGIGTYNTVVIEGRASVKACKQINTKDREV